MRSIFASSVIVRAAGKDSLCGTPHLPVGVKGGASVSHSPGERFPCFDMLARLA